MSKPRILICYSNPSDTDVLRLDKEHSAIDAALRQAQVDPTVVRRLHATTWADLVNEVARGNYDIVQFSGHGDESGIFLESHDLAASVKIDAEALQRLIKLAPHRITALVLTCCFSESYRESLSNLVPYLITVDGPAPDAAAIEFSKMFFAFYLELGSIEAAFYFAGLVHSAKNFDIRINRRGLLAIEGQLKIEAVVGWHDRIVLDLTAVREKIPTPPASRDRFLKAICTTLRVHFIDFIIPMERVVISFDQFLGIFSWENQIDPIVCHDVFTVAESVSERAFEAVMKVFNGYQSLAVARYRHKTDKEYAGKSAMLKVALARWHEVYSMFLEDNEELRRLLPLAYKVTRGLFSASISVADGAWAREEYPEAILHLETALTALHNLCLQAVETIKA